MSVWLIIGLVVGIWIASCLCVVAVCASAKEGDGEELTSSAVPPQHADALS